MGRMSDDVQIMSKYFIENKSNNVPSLKRLFKNEFHILELIRECLMTNEEFESLESFIVVIHKNTGADPMVTRYLVSDLWLLNSDRVGRKELASTLRKMQTDLQSISDMMNENNNEISKSSSFDSTNTNNKTNKDNNDASYVKLESMLKVLYEDRMAQG